MWVLVLLSILDLIGMIVVNPFNPLTILSIFTTGTFILRPFGVYIKINRIIPGEALIAFLSFNISLLLKTFSIKKYLLMLLIRGIFYLIVYYDDTKYVHIQEEEEIEL